MIFKAFHLIKQDRRASDLNHAIFVLCLLSLIIYQVSSISAFSNISFPCSLDLKISVPLECHTGVYLVVYLLEVGNFSFHALNLLALMIFIFLLENLDIP